MKRKTIFLTAILALIALVSFSNQTSAEDFAVGSTLENFTLLDTGGAEQSFDKLKGEKGAVVVFLSAQCPVVKMYNERINEIAAAYEAKGIKFIGINSNATESLEWVKSDAAEVGYKFPVLIDKGNVLADKLGATVTPEAYFFNEKNVLVYHGAIDNDRTGKNITDPHLKTAFEEKLAGKPVSTTRKNAFGCSIKRAEKKTDE
jgi:thiol-disulfide isomerase/thioredoxin